MRPVIEVNGLRAWTDGGALLLDGVGLTVGHRGVTALVGPSGSGKTTTALALLGEAGAGVRLSGSVRVAGTAVVDAEGVTAEAAGVRGSTVAYMPQHPGSALNPARRTGAVLTELARLHRESDGERGAHGRRGHEGDRGRDGGSGHGRGTGGGNGQERPGSRRPLPRAVRAAAKRRALDALCRAQLPADAAGDDVLRRFPHQFSGGQRQRVALAQVLACGPRVLVLDEPGTGLDTVTRAALADELASLARTGPAVLLLSHDHGLVRALAGHAVLLEDGRVKDEGPPARVLPGPSPVPVPGTAGTAGDARTAAPSSPVPPAAPVSRGTAVTSAPRLAPAPAPASTTAPAPAAAPSPLLDVRGLTAWLRPGRRDAVLHDVSLSLAPGDCLAVAGRSGSGKTTLARCVAGLHERHDGRLLLDGARLPVLRHRSREQKRRVQYVWQEVRGSFDERRTVLDQVARTAVTLRGVPAGEAAEEAAGLLGGLGISADTAERRPEALSGGELQRAAFARAVLASPDVLVCDEITTALDADATERIVAEVARLRRESGTGVLWIGHDLRLVRTVAERLLVLEGGGVAEEGDCLRVTEEPRSEAARLLLRAEHLGTGPERPALPVPPRE